MGGRARHGVTWRVSSTHQAGGRTCVSVGRRHRCAPVSWCRPRVATQGQLCECEGSDMRALGLAGAGQPSPHPACLATCSSTRSPRGQEGKEVFPSTPEVGSQKDR